MDDPKPLYVFLIIFIIFIFLWFFLGGKQCEFIGLRPLDPNHIMSYTDSSYKPKRKVNDKISDKDTIDTCNEKTSYDEESILDENADTLCVDVTPQLPEEFTRQTCIVTNDKFLSKGEKICRDTMEKIYGVPFKNTRPYWLKNDVTGRCLELDCYNERLKLAVEMNGSQHYKYPNIFHKTHQEFKEQVRRDKLKLKLCKVEGVHLIVVPYNVPHDMIPTYIMYHLPEIVKQRLKNEKIL